MTLLPKMIGSATDDTGAVLVLFAVFASVTILLMALVINLGNWFGHQRHLQLQADAAALAAAQVYEFPCTEAVKKEIYKTAGLYGGFTSVVTPEGEQTLPPKEPNVEPYNKQIGNTTQSNIHAEINKKGYFGQPSNGQPSETTTVEKAPCEPEADMIDVKLTETEPPWFFQAFGVKDIDAHARVSVLKESEATGVLPITESQPVEGRVYFVNDDAADETGGDKNYEDEVLATAPLKHSEASGKGGVLWTFAPASVSIKAAHIGVRIALSGKAGTLTTEGETKPTACTHEWVECFDEDGDVVPPLLNISGYSEEKTGTVKVPLTRKVTLSTPAGDTCTDGYFSNYLGGASKEEPCTFTIEAEVAYGAPENSTHHELTDTKGIKITPEVLVNENKKVAGLKELTHEEKGGTIVWTGTGKLPTNIPVTAENPGSAQINLLVACEPKATESFCKSASSEEKGTAKDVQRIFGWGPDGADRVAGASVGEEGGATKDADDFELCTSAEEKEVSEKKHPACEHKLVATIELSGSLVDATKYEKAPYHILYGDNDQDHDDQFVVACPPRCRRLQTPKKKLPQMKKPTKRASRPAAKASTK